MAMGKEILENRCILEGIGIPPEILLAAVRDPF
jgi:hypothetical protein